MSISLDQKLSMALDDLPSTHKPTKKTHAGGKAPRSVGGKAARPQKARTNQRNNPLGGAIGGTRIFVGNLDFGVEWQDLKKFCQAAGEVSRADVIERDGRSAGYGIVSFANVAAARRAIKQLDGLQLNGRPVNVRFDREASNDKAAPSKAKAKVASNTRVWVGNLDFGVSWQDLKDFCAGAGEVKRADVVEKDGKSAGFGIVEYATAAAARRATTKLSGLLLKGRPVNIRFDREAPNNNVADSSNRFIIEIY